MIADIGTRRVSSLATIDRNSDWINGHGWMTEHKESLPFKSFEEIRLNTDELQELKKESLCVDQWVDEIYQIDNVNENIKSSQDDNSSDICDFSYSNAITFHQAKDVINNIPEEVKICYRFSDYLIDLIKHRYKHVIRIVALVLRFIRNAKQSLKVNEVWIIIKMT